VEADTLVIEFPVTGWLDDRPGLLIARRFATTFGPVARWCAGRAVGRWGRSCSRRPGPNPDGTQIPARHHRRCRRVLDGGAQRPTSTRPICPKLRSSWRCCG